jgi:hypothetical protein
MKKEVGSKLVPSELVRPAQKQCWKCPFNRGVRWFQTNADPTRPDFVATVYCIANPHQQAWRKPVPTSQICRLKERAEVGKFEQ